MRTQVPGFLLDPDVDVGLQADVDRLCLSWGTPRVGECSAGVRGLMLAVLEEAIQSFLSHDRRVRDEAERWKETVEIGGKLYSKRARSPFSFTVVCETLGIEPGAARRALYRLRENNVSRKSLRRSRPNVRRVSRVPRRRIA